MHPQTSRQRTSDLPLSFGPGLQLRTAKTAIVAIIFDPATLLLVRRSCRMLQAFPKPSLLSRSGALDRHTWHTQTAPHGKRQSTDYMCRNTQILPPNATVHCSGLQTLEMWGLPLKFGSSRSKQSCWTAQRLTAYACLLVTSMNHKHGNEFSFANWPGGATYSMDCKEI